MNEPKFAVNNRVQYEIEDSDTILVGIVVEVFPPELATADNYWQLPQSEQDKMYSTYLIEFDNTVPSARIKEARLDIEDNDLEREFRLAYYQSADEIALKLEEALHALKQAEEIAIKYGVPFHSSLSPLYQDYVPHTFNKKYSTLASEFQEELTGTYYTDSLVGWQTSEIC